MGLTVVGGGHGSHCLWPNVVSVDMSALDQVYIVTAGENNGKVDCESGSLVVAEFPLHRGGELLRQHGFGKVNIQSLLVFGGM